MITNSRVLKSIAAALCAILVLLSPGLGAYEALAADFASAPASAGLPNGGMWAPRLQAMTAPAAAAPFQGATVRGVELGALLRDLSAVDLRSAAGRLEAAPVFERLAAAQAAQSAPLTQAQILEAVAAAAAEQRAAAAAVALRIEKGAGADEAAAVNAELRAATRHWALLGEKTRVAVAAQAKAFADRLETAKGARAAETVRETIAGWNAREANGGGVAAGVSAATQPRLSRFAAAAPAQEAPAVEKTSIAVLKGHRAAGRIAKDVEGAALVALPLVAAAFAAVLLPGVSPLLLLTAGVVASILLHETAHLFMLRRLGDDTAALHGVTGVNPLKLVDPLGTVALPIVSALVSQALLGVPVLLGWAKPIPVDFNKLADPKKDAMKVALAGPAMNAALAVVALGMLAVLSPLHLLPAAAAGLLLTFAKINGALAAFNLIPLPQLDGGKVLVGLLPQKLYDKWTANKRLPEAYQSTFKKLYEGPSTLLNVIGIDGQGRVNLVTRAVTVAVFGAFALAGWAWLGAPVALLMLVCSYDYYCIREKIQNEEATRSLMDILGRFSSALAQEAENDDSIQSVINTEEVEHILKNALEDTIDKVVDSEGFDELTPEQKMERFEAAYMDAAVEALHKKGMSADDPATIRRVLTKLGLGALAKGWADKYDVWAKWHSPLRKKKKSLRDAVKQKGKELGAGGGTLGMIALGLLGTGLLAAHGALPAAGAFAAAGLSMIAGTLQDAPRKPQPTFVEALNDENLRLTDKEKGFLQRLLKEMKLEKKAPVTGRVKELEQLLAAITSPRGVINSMVFVGKAGVGKTAVVELLAQLLAQSDARDFGTFKLTKMNGRYLVKLNLARLLQQDDPAAALDALLEILGKFNSDDKRTGNKVILFVDEIHQIFDHPKGTQMANLLKEPLRDGELTIVAATTDAEYKKYMQNDEAFRRRMIPVFLDESTVPETIRALEGARGYYEGLFGVTFTPEALKAAAEMSKFDQEVFLPGRAFKYLTLAASVADYNTRRDALAMKISDKIGDLRYVMSRLAEELATKDRLTENVKENEPTTIELYNQAVVMTQELVALYRERDGIPSDGTPVVSDELVKEEIARKTGVASGQLTLGSEPIEKYLEMEKIVGSRVIGQDEAIGTIAKAVRQNKAGLSDPKRPMGVFYLTGPTGSGKTHLAKELARFLFNDPEAVIRVDMTEYQESHAKSRMIGSPPGYVGYDAGGQLTEAVRKKPYSVILLDEIEKAHPDVFLLLLQIMGEGRLTDGQGRLVDFKNTMILMTSNLGMFAVDVEKYAKAFKLLQDQKRQAAIDGDAETIKMLDAQMKALAVQLSDETKKRSVEITEQAFKETYPPEFQGRLHAPPIVFNRITPESALKIAELNLKELRGVLGFAGHEIEWTPQVVEHVVNEGFSVALGARPLQNAIDRIITQPIATEILKAALANGQKVLPSHIKVSMEQGTVKIDVSPYEPQAPEKRSPGEGAAREVFASAISAAAAAAAGTATLPGIETVDEWIKTAMAAYPEEAPASTVESHPDATPEISANGGNVPAPAVTAPPPAAVKPAAQSSALSRPNTPLTLAKPRTFTAAHYENERKDANVKAAVLALAEAMFAQKFPDAQKNAVLRTIEDPADPHVGFLKLFVEQAKRMTPAEERARPVGIAFEAGDSLKVVVSRPGTLGEAELKVLRNHFTGPVPATAATARDKAEAMNAFMGEDGRRLMFDLYRKLSEVPGAKLGWAQTSEGVQYWLELPKPAAEPPPAPPAPPEGAAAQDATAALDPAARDLADEALKTAHNAINQRMQDLDYARERRILASAFTRSAAATLKTLPDVAGLSVGFSVNEERAVISLSRSHAFTPEERDAVLALFNDNPDLAHAIADSGSELKVQGTGLTLEIPNARAVSQGDGFARSTAGADESAAAAERAANAAKIGEMSSDDSSALWITFEGLRFETQIKPLLASLGLEYKERRESGALVRVRARLTKAALDVESLDALAALASRSNVRAITAVPALAEAVRERLANPPPPAAGSAKLQAAADGALDERSLWLAFEGADVEREIKPLLERAGAAVRQIEQNGRFARARVAFSTPAKAAFAALSLAGQDLVKTVSLRVDTLALARGLDKLGQHATLDVQTAPLTAYISMVEGADPAEAQALLGSALKVAESPWPEHPSHRLRAAFSSPAEAERALMALAARPDVKKIVVGSDLWRVLTEGIVTPAAGADAGLKGLARELALRIIEQGDQRSTSVRVAATDLLAAASTPQDLALARDWIRFDTTLSHRWPELAAAAQVLARHGSRADDEPRLLRAMGYLAFGGYGADTYKPAKRRLAESLAKVLATDNPARLRELLARYETEKDKGGAGWNARADEPNFHRYRNDVLVDALYVALCKHAGPEAMRALLDGWESKRTLPLFDYLKRVDPARLQALVERWRSRGSRPDGADKILMWYAVAEYGTREDARRLFEDASSGFGGSLDNQTTPIAAEAAARLVARTGAWEPVRDDVRRALREPMGGNLNFARMITAVLVAGAAGEASDLARLEEVMRSSPADVNYVHEMTQHEAAAAWAALLHRLGLVDRYLTLARPAPAGQPALPILQGMLADVNPIVNEAALEALRLRLTQRVPQQPAAPPPAPPSPDAAAAVAQAGNVVPLQGFYREGAPGLPADLGWSTYYFPEDTTLEAYRPELSLLSQAQRHYAADWSHRLSRILEGLLGVTFTPEVRTVSHPDGRTTIIWVLRQAVTRAVDEAQLSKVSQLLGLLLFMRTQPEETRIAQLSRLREQGYDDPAGLFALLQALQADPAARMGLLHDESLRHTPGRGETELWLKFEIAAAPAPVRPHAHLGDPLRPHGLRDPDRLP